jgi:DNA repair protein RecO (recombination protein O)
MTALQVLGHLPSLSSCAECGAQVELAGRVAFGQLSGGVLCAKCRPGKRHVVSVSAGVVRALARFAEPDSEAWRRIELDRRTKGELRGVLNHYLSHLLGRRPKMQNYLGALYG